MTFTNSDRIKADVRLVSSAVISFDESSLVEELEPVMKIPDTGNHPKEGQVWTEVPDNE